MAIKLADTARPNNYVDAEHLGTYPVAYAEDVWFTDGTRLSEKTFDGGSLQKDELPLASADELGKIYQFVGTTGTYINGYFYECVEESSTYTWIEKPVQSTEGLLHEASTLPTATSTNVDERFLYTGADTAELNHGGIYECQETDTDVYEWVLISAKGDTNIFNGTLDEWEALTSEEQANYSHIATPEEADGGSDIYSTTETKTNKVWIDGKPIYRKVVDFGNLTSGEKAVAHHITNLQQFLSINAWAEGVYSTYGNITVPVPNPALNLGIYTGSESVVISGTASTTGLKGTVVLEYTKTTDG